MITYGGYAVCWTCILSCNHGNGNIEAYAFFWSSWTGGGAYAGYAQWWTRPIQIWMWRDVEMKNLFVYFCAPHVFLNWIEMGYCLVTWIQLINIVKPVKFLGAHFLLSSHRTDHVLPPITARMQSEQIKGSGRLNPSNTSRSPKAGSMLGQSLRRSANIDPTLGEHLSLAGFTVWVKPKIGVTL